jgi:outer membrane protein assembly factor BamB
VRKAIAALAAVLLLVGGAILAYALIRERQSRDVRGSSTVEFVTTDVPEPEPVPVAPDIPWPMFAYDERRLHISPFEHRPPYVGLWRFRARTLLEFPPAIGHGRLFFANAAGTLFAVSARTGKRAWRYRARRCVAASPGIRGGTVFMTFLNRPPCNREGRRLTGELVALAAGTGKVRWRKEIGPSESSPLLWRGLLYIGDWRGIVYCYVARTGELKWTYRTKGEIKGALTLASNRLYVGSYDHRIYALNPLNGKLIWRASAQQRLGQRGRFYSTPAVAYGRVYVGATDGKVYSFGAASGKLRWSKSTGDFVYGSPAVYRQRVYVGSYNGRFYALDAATGDIKWQFKANGPISGSATIIDGIVYFATLKGRTYGLNARTGRRIWVWPDGKYSPVVADADRIYLVGHARLYALRERRKVESGARDGQKRAENAPRTAKTRARPRRRAGG